MDHKKSSPETPIKPKRRTGLLLVLLTYSAAVTFILVHFYLNSWTPSGNVFARTLIAASDGGKKVVHLGDPRIEMQRICFFPPSTGAPVFEIEKYFPNLPVIYVESDDSNFWYVAMRATDRLGIVILAVDHIALSWEYVMDAGTERSDPLARDVCPTAVRIVYFDDPDRPYLRPVYDDSWQVE